MSKREQQSAIAIMRAKAAISPEREGETPKTPKTPGKCGRPQKDRPKVEKYSAYFTPEQWEFLRIHAAQIVALGGDADRSAVLRALVDELRGKVKVP